MVTSLAGGSATVATKRGHELWQREAAGDTGTPCYPARTQAGIVNSHEALPLLSKHNGIAGRSVAHT